MPALNDRQTAILSLARASGHVEVEDLAHRFGVTPQTIRRAPQRLAAPLTIPMSRRMVARPSGCR